MSAGAPMVVAPDGWVLIANKLSRGIVHICGPEGLARPSEYYTQVGGYLPCCAPIAMRMGGEPRVGARLAR